jgi:hypothetical protein
MVMTMMVMKNEDDDDADDDDDESLKLSLASDRWGRDAARDGGRDAFVGGARGRYRTG